MLIDENKMQGMIETEIKRQVESKLKQIGRDTIKIVYKEVMGQQIRSFLMEQEMNLSKEIKEEIMYEKDTWKRDVTNLVSEQLVNTMVEALKDSGNY
ncbi:hypothetical protein COE51_01430 [Bacillus pseudomycoides]|nr:hypothetical protein COE51_01430 [Bacillus pseudomycoides]